MGPLDQTCVVVPAYNEAEIIGSVVDGLLKRGCEVVVVDDGSADGTYEACLGYRASLLRHACNLGQGAALKTGLTYALTHVRPRYLVTFDADGQHRPEDVDALVAALADGAHDIALGTRFARKADAAAVPSGRRLLLRAATIFSRVSSGLPVTDAHNGLRAFTAEAAAQLDLAQSGMAHASEILTLIRRKKLRWCEVPVSIDYSEYSRRKGQRGLGAINILWDMMTGRLR
ncbi:MAG TPA: glycosyltransferase family 2 protein [Thermoleophilia bacterium]|nr:glycosyltransferase family 2 protein [Thermoleophilia bacterium]